MSIEVSTNRTARERMAEWQTVQATLWDEIERIATLYSELATLHDDDDDRSGIFGYGAETTIKEVTA